MQESTLLKRCLPPNTFDKPMSGKLIIKIIKIVQSHSVKPIIAKIKFWGQQKHNYLQEGIQIVYTIHCTGKMLGQYFRDSGIGKLQFIDSRNNSEIGYSLINFLMYLKKTGPYNEKSGPFMLQETQIFSSILSSNKKTIGQVQLLINCDINQLLLKQSMNSQMITPNTSFNKKYQNKLQDSIMHSVRQHSNFQEPKQKSFIERDKNRGSNVTNTLENRFSKASVKIAQTSNIYYDANQDQDCIRQSNNNNNSRFKPTNEILNSNRSRNEKQLLESQHNIFQPNSQTSINNNKESYQLERMRLKLQAQELLGTKAQFQKFSIEDSNTNKHYHGKSVETIQIHSFTSLNDQIKKPKKQSKNIKKNEYIDLFINQDNIKKHCRIFPIDNEGTYQSVFAVSKHAEIQVFLSNQYGKNKFKVCQLYENNQIPIYGGKYNTIGFIRVIVHPKLVGGYNPQKEINSNNNNNRNFLNAKNINEQQKAIKKRIKQGQNLLNNSKNGQKSKSPGQANLNGSNFRQDFHKKGQESSDQDKMLLISIKSVYHPSQFQPIIQINELKWKYPYVNQYILKNPGKCLSIKIKNQSQSKQIAHGLISSYFQTTQIIQSNLRCSLVFDQNVRMRDALVHICLQIGNMKQVNYSINNRVQINTLSSFNNYKNTQQWDQQFNEKNKNNFQGYLQKNNAPNNNKININPLYSNQQQNYQQNYQNYYEKEQRSLSKNTNQFIRNNNNINNNQINMNNQQTNIKKQRLQTQERRRIQTQPASQLNKRQHYQYHQNQLKQQEQYSKQKSKMRQSNDHNNNDQIYLVQMLSRGLHKIPYSLFQSKIQNFLPKNKEQFIVFWNQLINQQDPILVEILSDIFIENDRLNFEQFIKCVKSYHNFIQLWWSIKLQALTKLITKEPQFQTKILKESQLGIISHSSLWKRALPQTSQTLKQKINKIYHLSIHSPLSLSQFFEDIKAIRNNGSRIPQDFTSNLISDLAQLIKQTIQQLITSIPCQFQEDIINIKTFCDLLLELDINVSYWQSLLLIEQIKGWYATDLQMNQGVISTNTIKQWIKAVVRKIQNKKQSIMDQDLVSKINRLVNINQNQSQKKGYQYQERREDQKIDYIPQRQSNIININSLINQNNKNNLNTNINLNKINNKNQIRVSIPNSANRSKLHSENNQSDIYNIANLLRQNDQMNYQTVSQTINNNMNFNSKLQSQLILQNNFNNKILNNVQNKKILEDLEIDKSSDKSSDTKRSQPQIIPLKHEPQYKFFQIEIRQLKYLKEIKQALKIDLQFTQDKTTYYFKKQSDIFEKSFWQKVDIKSVQRQRGSKGIQVFISGRDSMSIYARGILPIDDIIEKNSKPRTLLLYDKQRNIVGKIILKVAIFDEIPKSQTSSNNPKILKILIEQIKPCIHLRLSLNSQQQVLIQGLKQNQSYDLKIKSQLYNQNLIIEDKDGMVEAVIPLQQLFFKQEIKGQYPLVNNIDGRYIGSIKIKIINMQMKTEHTYSNIIQNEYINQNKNIVQNSIQELHETSNYNINTSINSTLKNTIVKKKSECLVIYIDEIISFSQKFSKIKKQLQGNLYIKKMSGDSLLQNSFIYKSQDIVHKFAVNNNLMITRLQNAKYIIQKIEPMSIQFSCQGKMIAECILPGYPYSGFLALDFNSNITSKSQRNYSLRLKVRVLRIPQTDYQVTRVLNSITINNLQNFSKLTNINLLDIQQQTLLKQIKKFNKLTFTQSNLIQKIIKINGKQLIFGYNHINKLNLNQDFIEQVLFHDYQSTGFLPQKKLQQLLKLCKVEYQLSQRQKHKQQIDIVPIIYAMNISQKNLFLKNRFQERSAYEQIDSLYNQISKKYK